MTGQEEECPYETYKITGKLYISGEIREASLLIKEGKIALLGKSLPDMSAPTLELGRYEVALPGMVDLHVHMRGLKLSHKEDWYSGTLSALKGGVTFVADMPNTVPPTVTISALEEKLEEAKLNALVDYGVYFGVPGKLDIYLRALNKGIIGLKIYPKDYRSPILMKLIKINSERGLITVLHAEDPEVEDKNRLAEVSAVKYFSKISINHGVRIHFTHISSSETVNLMLISKLKGAKVTFDITPHHAFLNEKLRERLGGIAIVRPPLRDEESRVAIYNSLRNLIADAYATDHAPHTLEEKTSEKPPPGFPGLEVSLGLLTTEVLERKASWRIIDLYSSRPAELLNIPKGKLLPGFDADIVVLDTKRRWKVKGESFLSKAKYTPFEGWELRGIISKVFIRGVKAYEEGEIFVKRGFGKMYGGHFGEN